MENMLSAPPKGARIRNSLSIHFFSLSACLMIDEMFYEGKRLQRSKMYLVGQRPIKYIPYFQNFNCCHDVTMRAKPKGNHQY